MFEHLFKKNFSKNFLTHIIKIVIYVLSGNTNGKEKTMWDYEVVENGIDENGNEYYINQYGRKIVKREFTTVETLRIVNGILASGVVMFTIMLIDAIIGMI